MAAFAQEMGILFTHSSPYFAQGNGQAEATNKIFKSIIQKMLEDNPRDWHEVLSQALWAYRTSQRGPTRNTPYALVYGHDAVLPMERAVNTLRIRKQPPLEGPEYKAAMFQVLDTVEQVRDDARGAILQNKAKMEQHYNRRVKIKTFELGDLVWRVILPLGSKDPDVGKWSPNWEGPYQIHQVLGKNVYRLKDLKGEVVKRTVNGVFLKQYLVSQWDRLPREVREQMAQLVHSRRRGSELAPGDNMQHAE